MEKRTLGRTGMEVSVLGFGGAEIGFESASVETVDRLLGAALDAGLNVVDTAECYDDSEELIGRAASHRRGEYFLFTKCGHTGRDFDMEDWQPAMLEKSIDRSLKRLKTDRLDLIQLHSCDEKILREGGVIEVVQRAREAGKTRFIGYSGDSTNAKYAVECGAFDTLQTSLNIADQEAVELTLPLAQEANMGVICKRPIANAVWRFPELPENSYYHTYWHRLKELAYPFLDRSVDDIVSIALRWTLATPGVGVAIVGTQNPKRWASNAALLESGALPQTEWNAIRAHWNEAKKPEWKGQT